MAVKFSVVIPIYNCEEFLGECIDSILMQTYQDFEIICVDDGSTDKTPEILEEYAKKDKRITVITQEQKGAGAARNAGLERAMGEYVYFPDSDDICNLDLLQLVEERIKRFQPEIVVFQAKEIHNETKKETLMYVKFPEGYDMFSAEDYADEICTSFMVAPWNKVFSRGFLVENDLKCQEIARTNDLALTCSALAIAKRICTISQVLYTHRVGLQTNLQSHNDKSPLDFYKALKLLHERIKNLANEKVEKNFRNLAVNIIFFNYLKCKMEKSRRDILEIIRKDAISRFGLYKENLSFVQGLLCSYVASGENDQIIRKLYGLNKFIEYIKATGLKNTIKKLH